MTRVHTIKDARGRTVVVKRRVAYAARTNERSTDERCRMPSQV